MRFRRTWEGVAEPGSDSRVEIVPDVGGRTWGSHEILYEGGGADDNPAPEWPKIAVSLKIPASEIHAGLQSQETIEWK